MQYKGVFVMKVRSFSVFSGVVLAATAGLISIAVPAHASSGFKELTLQTGDTFTTGQKGVLCEVRSAGFLECTRNTAAPYGVKTNVCGNAALDGIDLYAAGWNGIAPPTCRSFQRRRRTRGQSRTA